MIKDKCFTEEWLLSFHKQPTHKKIDPIILEKMIYALHLLEQLQHNGLEFIFKGGTSLILLLKEANRFSINIDIISSVKQKELEIILAKLIDSSKFTEFKLDERRSYKSGVPKAHYAFSYESSINKNPSNTILLDILIEDSLYPETTQKTIETKWVESNGQTEITVPTVDAITGDKLTAFAPNTIGIPYEKNGHSTTMEVCKQLYDLSELFGQISNMETVTTSFQTFAKQEIEYRKEQNPNSNLTPEQVLNDTITTCSIIAKRGKGTDKEQNLFTQLQEGISAFGTGYLMSDNFRIDDAIAASAKVAYLAAKLLINDTSSIRYYNKEDVKKLDINNQDWNFLNKLKKQPDKSSFYYWYYTVKILNNLNQQKKVDIDDFKF